MSKTETPVRQTQHVDVSASAWPAERHQKKSKEKKRESLLNRLSDKVHSFFMRIISNLRLSLTLRIALHYAWQLVRTILPVIVVLQIAVCCAFIQEMNTTMDILTAQQPKDGKQYTMQQLSGLPVTQAHLTDEVIENSLGGFGKRVSLAFSDMYINQQLHLHLYRNTEAGGVVAAYQLRDMVRMLRVVCWTAIFCDMMRIVYFVRHRRRLNKKVLKPISDMAEISAKLSAANLSDRISVEGEKNELKDLAQVINSMLDRIELSYNSQKQFVSDASHELRTPIAVIQGYVNMLQRWGKTDKDVLDEGITAISQETASMKELVERLLFLARHDKKTLMLEMEVFEPLEILSEVHREAKMLSSAHEFSLTPAEDVRIKGDKGMIKQLMRILVDNAIKYTPEGGQITLGVKRQGLFCVLSVTDTGAGIAPEDLPKIFDRFYRCDSARKAQTSGHGLGLSITRIITAAHGGQLKVRSKVGCGTTFSALLPIYAKE